MKNILLFIITLLLIFIFGSCESESPTEVGPSYVNSFYPMAIGNSWTYIDSTFLPTDTIVYSQRYFIVSSRNDSLGTWWRFHYQTNSDTDSYFAYELMEKNDSVYSYQYDVRPILSLEYIPPKNNDTIYFSKRINFDTILQSVAELSLPYETNAGNFNNSASYYYEWNEYKVNTVLCPKIGIIGWDIQNTRLNSLLKTRLLEYSLNKK